MIYLLDTNTISYLTEPINKAKKTPGKKTRGQIIIEKIRQKGYDNVFVNTVVVGEVYAGLYSKLTMKEERKKEIEKNLQLWKRLDMDSTTGKIYGDIKAALKREGKVMEDNDLWIAATAMTHEAVLVSNDRKFARIPGLKLENWIEMDE